MIDRQWLPSPVGSADSIPTAPDRRHLVHIRRRDKRQAEHQDKRQAEHRDKHRDKRQAERWDKRRVERQDRRPLDAGYYAIVPSKQDC